MKLSDVRFNIDPKTGSYVPVTPDQAKPPYLRFELRPVEAGETYRIVTNGIVSDQMRPFPLGMTRKIVSILRHKNGTEDETLHYGPDGTPVDSLPGVEPS